MEEVYIFIGYWLCWLTLVLFSAIVCYSVLHISRLHRLARGVAAFCVYKIYKRRKYGLAFYRFKDFYRNSKKDNPEEREVRGSSRRERRK